MKPAYKYISIIPIEVFPKTSVYSVNSISSYNRIGIIKWYAPWRRYCYFPEKDTVYSSGCLDDINDFIQQLMKEHKSKSKEKP